MGEISKHNKIINISTLHFFIYLTCMPIRINTLFSNSINGSRSLRQNYLNINCPKLPENVALLEVLEDLGLQKLVFASVSQGSLSLSSFPLDCLSFCLVSWLTISPFHLFKQTLSINCSEISFSQGFGVPKGINKSSQSFWPLWLLTIKIISPGSQSWLPSSLWQTDK